ncbi:MAG: nucleotide pyrophosphohydrolase [Magnetococcales bacterium]|nr:nucleotide pyrophosphohydrolase [Magnetococcales bacterium]
MNSLRTTLKTFSQAREWGPFHTSKNLSMALSVEVAEVVELFQWLTPQQSQSLSPELKSRLAEEVGDVMIYLTMLAANHNLDPLQCAQRKIVENEKKYPADKVRGEAEKFQ